MWRDLGEMARVRTNVQIALAPFPEVHHKIVHLAMGCFGETMASAQFGPSPASTVDPYSVHGSHFLLSVRFTSDKTDRMPGLKQLIDKGIYIFLMTENPAAGLALNTA